MLHAVSMRHNSNNAPRGVPREFPSFLNARLGNERRGPKTVLFGPVKNSALRFRQPLAVRHEISTIVYIVEGVP